MRIRDLLDAEGIQHLEVHLGLGDLELGDGNLTVINGQEVDQLLEVLDLLVGDLYRGLQCEDFALFLGLRFQQGFKCCLTGRELVEFLLVLFLL